MADAILYFAAQFGKGVCIAVGYKYRVVAKASCTTAFLDDGAVYGAFKQLGLFTY